MYKTVRRKTSASAAQQQQQASSSSASAQEETNPRYVPKYMSTHRFARVYEAQGGAIGGTLWCLSVVMREITEVLSDKCLLTARLENAGWIEKRFIDSSPPPPSSTTPAAAAAATDVKSDGPVPMAISGGDGSAAETPQKVFDVKEVLSYAHPLLKFDSTNYPPRDIACADGAAFPSQLTPVFL